jgi:hypothetical protein
MKKRGRPVRGVIGGLLLGIFLDIDLAFGGVVKLNSVVLTILPIALLVLGLALGLWAPIGRSRGSGGRLASPLPPPVAWPDSAPVEGSTAPVGPPPTSGVIDPPPPPI